MIGGLQPKVHICESWIYQSTYANILFGKHFDIVRQCWQVYCSLQQSWQKIFIKQHVQKRNFARMYMKWVCDIYVMYTCFCMYLRKKYTNYLNTRTHTHTHKCSPTKNRELSIMRHKYRELARTTFGLPRTSRRISKTTTNVKWPVHECWTGYRRAKHYMCVTNP